jgi:hypothetical protein
MYYAGLMAQRQQQQAQQPLAQQQAQQPMYPHQMYASPEAMQQYYQQYAAYYPAYPQQAQQPQAATTPTVATTQQPQQQARPQIYPTVGAVGEPETQPPTASATTRTGHRGGATRSTAPAASGRTYKADIKKQQEEEEEDDAESQQQQEQQQDLQSTDGLPVQGIEIYDPSVAAAADLPTGVYGPGTGWVTVETPTAYTATEEEEGEEEGVERVPSYAANEEGDDAGGASDGYGVNDGPKAVYAYKTHVARADPEEPEQEDEVRDEWLEETQSARQRDAALAAAAEASTAPVTGFKRKGRPQARIRGKKAKNDTTTTSTTTTDSSTQQQAQQETDQ